jgi:hypothetical protein
MNIKYLLFFVISFNVFAQDYEEMFPEVTYRPEISRYVLHRLNFMPKRGDFIFKTQTYSSSVETNWDEGGTVTKSDESTIMDFRFDYGQWDSFSLFVSASFLVGQKTTFSNVASTEFVSRGVGEYAAGYKWRLIEQGDFPSFLDWEVGISPKTGTAKRPDTNGGGNNMRGGKLTYTTLYFTRQFSSIEVQFHTSYQMYEEYSEANGDFTTNTAFEAYNKYEVGIVYQYESFKNAFARFGLQYNKFSGDSFSNSDAYKLSKDTSYELSLHLGTTIFNEQATIVLGVISETGTGKADNGTTFESDISDLRMNIDFIVGNFH